VTPTDQGFEVILVSAPEYRALAAEIFFNGKFVALVTQERGLDRLELEIPQMNVDESKVIRKVPINGFLDCIAIARERLRTETER
jgi:hypothetical protein